MILDEVSKQYCLEEYWNGEYKQKRVGQKAENQGGCQFSFNTRTNWTNITTLRCFSVVHFHHLPTLKKKDERYKWFCTSLWRNGSHGNGSNIQSDHPNRYKPDWTAVSLKYRPEISTQRLLTIFLFTYLSLRRGKPCNFYLDRLFAVSVFGLF